MGQGQVSNQGATSWYTVITASSYQVAVLVMSLINYVTHQYTNTTQNTPHKTTQAPHKTSPGKGLQSLIALFIVLKSFFFQGQVSNQSGVASKRDVLVPGHHCSVL